MICRIGQLMGRRPPGSGASGPWTPASQPGLVFHFEPSSVQTSGSNVTSSGDLSGLSHACTPIATAPTFGSGFIDFTGGSRTLETADHNDLDVGTGDFIYAAIFKFTGNTAQGIMGKDAGSSGYFFHNLNGTMRAAIRASSGAHRLYDISGLNDGVARRYIMYRVGGAFELKIDGVSQTGMLGGASGAVNCDNTGTFKLGAGDSGAGSLNAGQIKAGILWKATADATLLTNIDTYLAGL